MNSVRVLFVLATALGLQSVVTAQPLAGTLNLLPSVTSGDGLSRITVSGFLSTAFGNLPIQEQGAGSLTTSYTGTLAVGFDLGANTIQFSGGSLFDAAISGSWQPLSGGGAGNAPADYGIFINAILVQINAAVRNFTADLSSGSLAMTGGGALRTFGSGETLTVLTGDIDYNTGTPGALSIAGQTTTNAGANGTFQIVAPDTYRVTVPIAATLLFQDVVGTNDLTVNLNGQIVAQGVIIAVPEPTTIAFLGLAGLGGAYTGFRRLRQRGKIAAALGRYKRG